MKIFCPRQAQNLLSPAQSSTLNIIPVKLTVSDIDTKVFQLLFQFIKLNQIYLLCLNGIILGVTANTRFSAVHICCIHLLMSTL